MPPGAEPVGVEAGVFLEGAEEEEDFRIGVVEGRRTDPEEEATEGPGLVSLGCRFVCFAGVPLLIGPLSRTRFRLVEERSREVEGSRASYGGRWIENREAN